MSSEPVRGNATVAVTKSGAGTGAAATAASAPVVAVTRSHPSSAAVAPSLSSSTAPSVSSTPSEATAVTAPVQEVFPSPQSLFQAAKLAIKDDRPIHLDYYQDSAAGRAFVGEDGETKEKVLIKSKDEFTSNITKMYKSGDDFIVLTENSLYIVSAKIQKRRVNLRALHTE